MAITSTASPSRPISLTALLLGVIGTLLVVGVLSLTYFRPNDAYAVQGASSVTCGSPSLLMTGLTSGPGIAQFSSSGTSTQQLVSCSSPFGGTTQTVTLRASRYNQDVKVTYNIYVDGSSTPLITVAANRLDGTTQGMAAGWSIGTDFISTSVPIKFNTAFTITATVEPVTTSGTRTTYVGAHVQFLPDAQEVPVKFLNAPLVNVNGPIHAIIDGQPIQTHNNP